MNEEYRKLKSSNKYSIIIVKFGIFYNAYGKDAIIIGNLLSCKTIFYGNKLCVSIHNTKLDLLLSRLRMKGIPYIVLGNNRYDKYIGEEKNYIKLYSEVSLVQERNVLLDEIFEELTILDYDKLKEIKKIIERK